MLPPKTKTEHLHQLHTVPSHALLKIRKHTGEKLNFLERRQEIERRMAESRAKRLAEATQKKANKTPLPAGFKPKNVHEALVAFGHPVAKSRSRAVPKIPKLPVAKVPKVPRLPKPRKMIPVRAHVRRAKR
jgi:hypothetical protein